MLFENATYLSQVRILRVLAEEVLKSYDIGKIDYIKFIKHGGNAIFKVQTKNKPYMLRICPEYHHGVSALHEEFKWLNSIRANSNIAVPYPIENKDGQYITDAKHQSMVNKRNAVLFEWVSGRRHNSKINKNFAAKLGSLIAELQILGKSISITHRDYWRTEGLVGIEHPTFCNLEKLSLASNYEQGYVTEIRQYIFKKINEYEELYPDKIGLIHGDLHQRNCVMENGKLGAIDFDDCGLGFYLYDLIVPLASFSFFYDTYNEQELESIQLSLFESYSKHITLSAVDLNMIDHFILARVLTEISFLEKAKDNSKFHDLFSSEIHKAIKLYEKIQKL